MSSSSDAGFAFGLTGAPFFFGVGAGVTFFAAGVDFVSAMGLKKNKKARRDGRAQVSGLVRDERKRRKEKEGLHEAGHLNVGVVLWLGGWLRGGWLCGRLD
jgi:hypothetical protein